jgi:hypothetical protein
MLNRNHLKTNHKIIHSKNNNSPNDSSFYIQISFNRNNRISTVTRLKTSNVNGSSLDKHSNSPTLNSQITYIYTCMPRFSRTLRNTSIFFSTTAAGRYKMGRSVHLNNINCGAIRA